MGTGSTDYQFVHIITARIRKVEGTVFTGVCLFTPRGYPYPANGEVTPSFLMGAGVNPNPNPHSS